MERIEISQEVLNGFEPQQQVVAPVGQAPMQHAEQVVPQAAPVQAAPVAQAAPVQQAAPAQQAPVQQAPAPAHENIEQDEDIIVDMKSTEFENLLKVLLKISDGAVAEDVLQIKAGLLTMSKYGGIVKTDLTPIFGNKSWDIINPNRAIKILKLLKNGDRIKVIRSGQQQLVYNMKGDKILNIVKLFSPTVKAKGDTLIQDIVLGDRIVESKLMHH